jgi:hypothetical protein
VQGHQFTLERSRVASCCSPTVIGTYLVLAMGDTVILAENDCNDTKITCSVCRTLRNASQGQSMTGRMAVPPSETRTLHGAPSTARHGRDRLALICGEICYDCAAVHERYGNEALQSCI